MKLSLCIADARDKVVRIKKQIQAGKTVEEACIVERYSIKAYYADIDYLNRNWFNYKKDK